MWKSFLEGTIQVTQSRLNICENYKNLISEPARAVKCFKEQQLKKVFSLDSFCTLYVSFFQFGADLFITP